MKPAQFEYHDPSTVGEVFRIMEEYEETELMAGNQSLGFDMATRDKSPDHLIDISDVSELSFIDITPNQVEIGATVTHRTVEQSDALGRALPILPTAAKIAGPIVRNKGTVGGGIAEADPAGNYPPAVLAVDAEINLRSADERRAVPASEFFISHKSTDMREDELIESVTVDRSPFPMERTGMAYIELKRSALAWADVSAAAVIRVAEDDGSDPTIEYARLALANVAETPPVVDSVSGELVGSRLTESAATAVERAATAATDATGERGADGRFKSDIAGTYARRAVELAYERAVSGHHRGSTS